MVGHQSGLNEPAGCGGAFSGGCGVSATPSASVLDARSARVLAATSSPLISIRYRWLRQHFVHHTHDGSFVAVRFRYVLTLFVSQWLTSSPPRCPGAPLPVPSDEPRTPLPRPVDGRGTVRSA